MSTVKIPDFVDYPEFYDVGSNSHLFQNLFCYIIEPYPFEGSNLYIGFREGSVLIRLSDFKSNDVDMASCSGKHRDVLDKAPVMVEFMKASRIIEASFYFSHAKKDVILVDMMLSANKFAGPGMLRDLFGKIMPTQTVLDIQPLKTDIVSSNKGKLVKPSRFRYVLEGNHPRPQYGVL